MALAGDRVVGTTLAGYDGHRSWLYSVAVYPEFQATGIGTQLVRHAERALTELGCVKINLQVLQTNQGVVAFYQSIGYAVEERISLGRKIEENIPRISQAPLLPGSVPQACETQEPLPPAAYSSVIS